MKFKKQAFKIKDLLLEKEVELPLVSVQEILAKSLGYNNRHEVLSKERVITKLKKMPDKITRKNIKDYSFWFSEEEFYDGSYPFFEDGDRKEDTCTDLFDEVVCHFLQCDPEDREKGLIINIWEPVTKDLYPTDSMIGWEDGEVELGEWDTKEILKKVCKDIMCDPFDGGDPEFKEVIFQSHLSDGEMSSITQDLTKTINRAIKKVKFGLKKVNLIEPSNLYYKYNQKTDSFEKQPLKIKDTKIMNSLSFNGLLPLGYEDKHQEWIYANLEEKPHILISGKSNASTEVMQFIKDHIDAGYAQYHLDHIDYSSSSKDSIKETTKILMKIDEHLQVRKENIGNNLHFNDIYLFINNIDSVLSQLRDFEQETLLEILQNGEKYCIFIISKENDVKNMEKKTVKCFKHKLLEENSKKLEFKYNNKNKVRFK